MDEGKRAFMRKGLVGTLYAVAAAVFAVPIFSFITFRKIDRRTVRFSVDEQRASVNLKDNVFLVKKKAGDAERKRPVMRPFPRVAPIWAARCALMTCRGSFGAPATGAFLTGRGSGCPVRQKKTSSRSPWTGKRRGT